jgi:serine phosphatase RsbU (regulator of sigma subunit)
MTTPEIVTLQRVLDRRDINNLLAAFAAPGLSLALLRADGRMFASAGEWPAGELDGLRAAVGAQPQWPAAGGPEPWLAAGKYRCYVLAGNDQPTPLGLMVACGGEGKPACAAMEAALRRSLASLVGQGLEKRAIATETLDRYREINLLYRIGETIGASLDPAAITRLVLDETNRVIEADSGLLLLFGEDAGAPDIGGVLGPGEQALELHELAEEVIALVTQTGRPAIVAEPAAHGPQNRLRNFSGVLCAPLKAQEKIIGHIVLGRLQGQPMFTASDEKLLMALAGQTAIALENARLHESSLARERLARELQLARDLQASLIPRQVPEAPGWDFAAWWRPANEVSGDFYDFMPRENGQLGLVVADVSDKGMASALYMALTRSVVRASTLGALSAAEGLTRANRLLCADSIGGMFVTLVYAQLDTLSRELVYVNCGHNPPLHFRAAQQELLELTADDIMVGFDDSWQFHERRVQLAPGDVLVFFTDGVTEAVSPQQRRFEDERLQAIVRRCARRSATELLREIQAELYRFMANTPAHDDITLMVVKCL